MPSVVIENSILDPVCGPLRFDLGLVGDGLPDRIGGERRPAFQWIRRRGSCQKEVRVFVFSLREESAA